MHSLFVAIEIASLALILFLVLYLYSLSGYRRDLWVVVATFITWLVPVLTSPVHEAAHAAAMYLVGVGVAGFSLTPEVGPDGLRRAWVTSGGPLVGPDLLLVALAPYVLYMVYSYVGATLLRRRKPRHPLVSGPVFAGLCLLPIADIASEATGLILYGMGDFRIIQNLIGDIRGWLFIAGALWWTLSNVLSVLDAYRQAAKAAEEQASPGNGD